MKKIGNILFAAWLIVMMMCCAKLTLASGQCPADPDDPIGQIECGEWPQCNRNRAWTGYSCKQHQDYWCCATPQKPKPRDAEAASLPTGVSLRIVEAGTLRTVDEETRPGTRVVVTVLNTEYIESASMWVEQVLTTYEAVWTPEGPRRLPEGP